MRRTGAAVVAPAAVALLLMLVAAPVQAQEAESQQDTARDGASRAATLFLGAHGLGIGVEIPLADRVHLAIRAQGLLAERTILAAGLRADLARADHGAIYLAGLLGRVGCGSTLYYNACTIDAQNGAAAIAGFEISVSGGDRVLLGGEAGYWFTAAGDDASLQHPIYEFVVRIREH